MSIELNRSSFDSILKTKLSENINVAVMHLRDTKTLVINKNKLYVCRPSKSSDINGMLSKKEVRIFINSVKMSINRYIKRMDFQIEVLPSIMNTVRHFNHDEYDKVKPGDIFVSFDLDNAYWQTMRRQGILSDNLYQKYRHDKRYKFLKQVVIGFINAEKKAEYYRDGKLILKITEDIHQWQNVYYNVRQGCYNVPALIAKHLNMDYIALNQDSITVKMEQYDSVVKYLTDNGFEFKKAICNKIDEKTYECNGRDLKVPVKF